MNNPLETSNKAAGIVLAIIFIIILLLTFLGGRFTHEMFASPAANGTRTLLK